MVILMEYQCLSIGIEFPEKELLENEMEKRCSEKQEENVWSMAEIKKQTNTKLSENRYKILHRGPVRHPKRGHSLDLILIH